MTINPKCKDLIVFNCHTALRSAFITNEFLLNLSLNGNHSVDYFLSLSKHNEGIEWKCIFFLLEKFSRVHLSHCEGGGGNTSHSQIEKAIQHVY